MPDDRQRGKVLSFDPIRSAGSSPKSDAGSPSAGRSQTGSVDDAKRELIEKLRKGGYLDLKRG
jgi:hypothetical protein